MRLFLLPFLLSSLRLCSLLGSLTACSLVSLSSDIEQAQCATDADCDALNDHDAPDYDPCEIWQCADTLLCERYALDGDDDGFTPRTATHDGEELVCETEASRIDCDDGEELSSPDVAEMCDDFDNDCDDRTDEGVLEDKVSVVSAFADENADGPGELSYAVDPDSGTVAVAYAISRGSETVPGFSTITGSLASGSPVDELRLPASDTRMLRAASVGVGALGGDRFGVAFRSTSGAKVVIAGVVEPRGGALELVADASILRIGLACGADEACSANDGSDPAAAVVDVPATSTPALAALDDELLVVYSRTPEDEGCVSKEDAAPIARVLANRLLHASGRLTELDEAASSIGMTADASSPAVLAVPAPATGAEAPGWLVAFSNLDGDIELRQVRAVDGALDVSDSLLTISDADERLTDVSVTLGSVTGDARVLGIAAQRGCGVSARVVAFTARVASAEDGTLSASAVARDIAVGGEASESRPSIAYSAAREAFVVAYRDPSGLRARVLGAGAAVFGDASYLLLRDIDSGDDELHITSAPLAIPLSSPAGWFGAVAATQRADDRVLQTVTLSSCR